MRKRTDPPLPAFTRYMKVLVSRPKSKMRWKAAPDVSLTQVATVTSLSCETMPGGRVTYACLLELSASALPTRPALKLKPTGVPPEPLVRVAFLPFPDVSGSTAPLALSQG